MQLLVAFQMSSDRAEFNVVIILTFQITVPLFLPHSDLTFTFQYKKSYKISSSLVDAIISYYLN